MLLPVGAVASAVLVAVSPGLVGGRLHGALTALSKAQPAWLWLGAVAALGSLTAAAAAWRTVMRSCGADLSLRDSCARYGMGSLANTVLPFQLGEAVRVALFSRRLANRGRLWSAGGGLLALAAARAACLAALVAFSSILGATPLWPAAVLGGATAATVIVSLVVRNRAPASKVGRLLDALIALGRAPRHALAVVGWVALSTGARVLTAAAVAASLGVHSPLLAAVLVVAALDVAGQFPLTPGNVGVANGAVALALASHGIDVTSALAVGLGMQAVETSAAILFGAAGALHLAPVTSVFGRPLVARLAPAVAAAATAAAFGYTVVPGVS